RGLFRKKPVALRIAAVQALATAGTPPALDALVALQGDRERDVQQAAVAALEEKVRTKADLGTAGAQETGKNRTF
ncbi:MAG TPA: HEAT repeat domain-containing protein, partial [Gemmatimonadaceae bacterium]|nr:HEAT repeat domain-containing protein [Gemmatimonadaceae bacterium]